MKHSIKIEKFLPFIIAIILPGINFLNNKSIFEQFTITELFPSWITTFFILIFLWYVNDWLSNKIYKYKYLMIVLVNILIASIFIIPISFFSPTIFNTTDTLSWMLAFRILFASVIIIAIQQSLKSAKTVEKLKSENISLKTEKYKAELDQLRKQVNPHFLFNSLSTLRSMIRDSDPNSEDFILNLSSLYRQILQSREKDYVTVEEEIKFLNAYIYLLKVRHLKALQVNIEIDPQSYQYSIPIFALQLLVENCVKHNIIAIDKPLEINIIQENEITITVSNQYQPKEKTQKSIGVGIKNLMNRYELMGIDQGLEIDKSDNHFRVKIKLF